MAQSVICLGHKERQNEISKLASKSIDSIDENLRVLIKKGPMSNSIETSLKKLEDNYKSKAEFGS